VTVRNVSHLVTPFRLVFKNDETRPALLRDSMPHVPNVRPARSHLHTGSRPGGAAEDVVQEAFLKIATCSG